MCLCVRDIRPPRRFFFGSFQWVGVVCVWGGGGVDLELTVKLRCLRLQVERPKDVILQLLVIPSVGELDVSGLAASGTLL